MSISSKDFTMIQFWILCTIQQGFIYVVNVGENFEIRIKN